jgi:hypothetical protein
MSIQKLKFVIQLRRDTAANWERHKDSVPSAGEPCFILDENILKIGDGVTKFKDLEPINGVKLSADGKSIILDNGEFKLAGFDAAEVGAQPQKTDNGIKWVVPVDLSGAVETLKSDVKTAQGDIKALQETDGSLLSKIGVLENKMDGAGEGTVDAKIAAKIKAFEEKVTDNGTIDTIQELITYVSDHGSEVQAMVNDIAGLKLQVGEGSVESQIAVAVASKVDKVEGMGLSTHDFTDALLAKLEAIEENAQVNVIEQISVGGSILDAVDKTINIPVAGLDKAGVVKSSTGANMVNIANDGTMSVKKIGTNSLFVPIGDELILDGGSADKNAPIYTVRIGNMGCNSISDAVAAADNGDVVTLQEDVNMGSGDNDHLVVATENVTIDLGGKELTANGSNGAVKVEGGVTILDGVGTVKGTLGSDNYSMAVWCDNGRVVINDGIYRNATDNSARGTDLIYASNTGCIEINNGVFEAANPEWTLNVKDTDYKAGTANIIVKGGKFKNFDPANNNAEGAGTNFVADGYKSVLEGEYYVVKPI